MKITIFTLADFAQNNLGKLSIIGTFNQLKADKFPFLYPVGFHIVARVVSQEAFSSDFVLSCKAPDNSDFIPPLTGHIEIKSPVEDTKEKFSDIAVAVGPQVFKTPGTYTFRLQIANCQEELKLYVEQAPLAN